MYQWTFNIGGAVGDSTWIEAGEVPIVTMQGEADYFAPFQYGIVTVPGTTVFRYRRKWIQ